ESVLEAAVARVREAIDVAQAGETTRGTELTACRVELASASERVEALGRELARLDEMERDLVGRLAQAEQRQTQLAERQTWLAEERERTDVGARDVAAERDRIDAEARRANELHEGLASEVRAVEHEARGAGAGRRDRGTPRRHRSGEPGRRRRVPRARRTPDLPAP